MTQLGKKLGAIGDAKSPTALSRVRSSFQRGEVANFPLLGPVWIELPGDAIIAEIEGAVWARMEELKLSPNAINAFTYSYCRSAHTLAWAVREVGDHDVRFGTVDEWSGKTKPGIDMDLLVACDLVYSDVRERLDPIGLTTLTKERLDDIRAAFEKKNLTLLRSFGVSELSIWLCSTDVQLANCPIPSSSSGQSSPEG